MIVPMHANYEVTPEQIAQALVNAKPWEFAVVWRELHVALERSGKAEEMLRAFSERMAPANGAACQKPLRRLVQLIDFYAESERMKPCTV